LGPSTTTVAQGAALYKQQSSGVNAAQAATAVSQLAGGGVSLKESSAFHKLNQKMKQKRNNVVATNGQLGSMVGGAQ
jgi:hypothetical protein